ncbi:MAG: hypothetical protein IKI11_03355 [Neisseriaceae bacterium]|nr:hypothetical protein [Neisseriaceae bacterium]
MGFQPTKNAVGWASQPTTTPQGVDTAYRRRVGFQPTTTPQGVDTMIFSGSLKP